MAPGIAAPGDRRRYSEPAALKELGGYPKWFGDGAPIPTLIDSIVWQRFMKATGGRRTARSWSAPIFEPGTLESFRLILNREGFPNQSRCDSSLLLDMEAGMNGATLFPGFA